MIDCHLHTNFSPDGSSTLEEYCLRAAEIGCSRFAVCDHLDIGYPDIQFETDIHPAEYTEAIHNARKSYPQLQISLGIEAGYMTETAQRTAMFLTLLPLDFVINSVHVVGGTDPYYSEYFDQKTREQAYLPYLEAVYESLDAPYDFSVLGHITYVSRTAPYLAPGIEWRDAPDLLDAILMRIIYLGKGLEVNSSSLHRIGSAMPSASIVKRYRELGGELITFGSDAHNANRLCADYTVICELLKQCGFQYIAFYKNMKPEMISL